MPQVADPAASIAKFDRELVEYHELAADYRGRGWLLLRAEFPEILVALAAPQLKPSPIVTGVLLDYTDYDARPPSVRLVNPFTSEPYLAKDLPTSLVRRTSQPVPDGFAPPGLPPGAVASMLTDQPLMQSYGPDEIPFLCLPGIREYHDNPGHSGDPWELHRPAGAGRLVRILHVVDTYGVRPINGFNIALAPQIAGFSQNEIPA
jgi:hypothetical protein